MIASRLSGVKIGEEYRKLARKLEALTLRERVLVVLSVLAVTWMVWDWTFERAIGGRVDAAKRELAASRAQLAAQLEAQRALAERAANDSNRALEKELHALEGDIAANDSRLEELVGKFISPEEMTSALEDIVTHHPNIALERVVSLPVEPVRLGGGKEPPVTGLYRHALRVEVTAGYFDLMRYLEDLEATEWRFGWRTFEYRVASYPRAVAMFEIETLSRHRDLLGIRT
jgi:MSHA biogenesis protein MshJ